MRDKEVYSLGRGQRTDKGRDRVLVLLVCTGNEKVTPHQQSQALREPPTTESESAAVSFHTHVLEAYVK